MAQFIPHDQIIKIVEDYCIIGKDTQAFEYLKLIITTPKKRGQWTIQFEKVMLLYINLCMKLKNYQVIKEGVSNYKYMSQNANIQSLETVINYYKDSMEKSFKESIEQYSEEDMKLLELDLDPEDSMIYSIDFERIQKKTEIQKFIKIMGDGYRNIVDIVRSNNKLENLMVQICEKGIQFLVKYQRKYDFKKFYEYLKTYLSTLMQRDAKILSKAYAIDISKTQTNTHYAMIFFEFLKGSIDMKMWGDSLRIIQDISMIMQARNALWHKKQRSDYYLHFSKILQASQYYLFQAFAYYQHYMILKKFGKPTHEELQKQTDLLIIQLMSCPPINQELAIKEDAKQRLSKLLSHSGYIPDRQQLINMVKMENIIEFASPLVQEFFRTLDGDIGVCQLNCKGNEILEYLKSINEYHSFIPQMQKTLLYKSLKSIQQTFKSIKLSTMQRLLSFSTRQQLYEMILVAQNSGFINVKINYENQSIMFVEQEQTPADIAGFMITFSEKVQTLANRMQEVLGKEEKKEKVFNISGYLQSSAEVMKERQKLITELKNPKRIKKEYYNERGGQKPQKTEMEMKMIEKQEKMQRHMQKLLLERKKKTIKQLILSKNQIVLKINGIKLEDLTENQIDEITEETIVELKLDLENRQKDNLEKRNKNTFQRVDYLERAKREDQLKILKSMVEQAMEKAGGKFEEQVIKEVKAKYDKYMALKQQLLEQESFKTYSLENMLRQRQEKFNKEIVDFKEQVEKEYKKKIIERALQLQQQYEKDEQERSHQLEEELKKEEEMKQKQKDEKLRAEWRRGQVDQKEEEKLPTEPVKKAFGLDRSQMGSQLARATENPPQQEPQPPKAKADAYQIERKAQTNEPQAQAIPRLHKGAQKDKKPIEFTRGGAKPQPEISRAGFGSKIQSQGQQQQQQQDKGRQQQQQQTSYQQGQGFKGKAKESKPAFDISRNKLPSKIDDFTVVKK